jgi:FixJ family two-component response regulator
MIDNISDATVIIVDDDAEVRTALENLLRSMDFRVKSFASAQKFMEGPPSWGPCCLVLDVRLPGQSGLELQAQLAAQGVKAPIVFISGYADVRMSVKAMKAGAVEFLQKPFRDQDLLDAVQNAIERDRQRLSEEKMFAGLKRRYETLTMREREIFPRVTAGLTNKVIAAALGLSEITVKIHRGNIMRKMAARTLADLVRIDEKLKRSGA